MANVDVKDYLPYDPLTVGRRTIAETEAEDPGPRSADSVARLLAFSDFIRPRIAKQPGSWEVHKRLMEMEPSVYQGDTNFRANPKDWFDPLAMLYSTTARTQLPKDDLGYVDPIAEGAVFPSRPQQVHISPSSRMTSSSALLGHELSHTGEGLLTLRNERSGRPSQPTTDVDWNPRFPDRFMDDAYMATGRRVSPYYSRYGIGFKSIQGMQETMGYLMGREADLPVGQTLLDDPQTNWLFKNHPGTYEMYTKSRDRIKDAWRKRNQK